MKRVLTALSALSVINLLGVLGAVGWLAATQRLSGERVEAIKQILHEPLPTEKARLDAEAKAAATGEPRPEDQPLPAGPPLSSDQLVSMQGVQGRAEEFRAQRLERESQTLAQTTRQEIRKLDEERRAFIAQRDAFQTMQEQIVAMRGDEQFQAAISVLAQVKPDKAKAMLQEIIEGRAGALGVGDAGGMTGIDRAVAYLDELDDMIRGKVMTEFVDDSPTLAADLLERLRTFGLMADASGGASP